jgi:coiled-coil family 90 protein
MLVRMATVTFDTLKYAQRLKEGGLPPEQAEAQARALAEVLQVNMGDLVTRQDLQIELAPIRTDLAVLKWMVGILLAGVASLVLKTFFSL